MKNKAYKSGGRSTALNRSLREEIKRTTGRPIRERKKIYEKEGRSRIECEVPLNVCLISDQKLLHAVSERDGNERIEESQRSGSKKRINMGSCRENEERRHGELETSKGGRVLMKWENFPGQYGAFLFSFIYF